MALSIARSFRVARQTVSERERVERDQLNISAAVAQHLLAIYCSLMHKSIQSSRLKCSAHSRILAKTRRRKKLRNFENHFAATVWAKVKSCHTHAAGQLSGAPTQRCPHTALNACWQATCAVENKKTTSTSTRMWMGMRTRRRQRQWIGLSSPLRECMDVGT